MHVYMVWYECVNLITLFPAVLHTLRTMSSVIPCFLLCLFVFFFVFYCTLYNNNNNNNILPLVVLSFYCYTLLLQASVCFYLNVQQNSNNNWQNIFCHFCNNWFQWHCVLYNVADCVVHLIGNIERMKSKWFHIKIVT